MGFYDIVVKIIGVLPEQFTFIYYIFVVLLGLVVIWCITMPFTIAYELIKGGK